MQENQKPLRDSSPDSDRTAAGPQPLGTDVEKTTGPAPLNNPASNELGPPPDGGREAWMVVLGGFCTVFSSFGWINCEFSNSMGFATMGD